MARRRAVMRPPASRVPGPPRRGCCGAPPRQHPPPCCESSPAAGRATITIVAGLQLVRGRQKTPARALHALRATAPPSLPHRDAERGSRSSSERGGKAVDQRCLLACERPSVNALELALRDSRRRLRRRAIAIQPRGVEPLCGPCAGGAQSHGDTARVRTGARNTCVRARLRSWAGRCASSGGCFGAIRCGG